MIATILIATAIATNACDNSLVVITPSYTYSWQAQVNGPFTNGANPTYSVEQPCEFQDELFADDLEVVVPDDTYTVYYNDSHDGLYFPTARLGPMQCARQVSGTRTVLSCP